jgi:hypothetical protein
MHTFKVNVQDNLVEKVYNFLKSLPKNEIDIIEDIGDKKRAKENSRFTAISIDTRNFTFDREEANAR